MHMRNNPLIYTVISIQSPKAKKSGPKLSSQTQMTEATKQKGNLLIRELWKKGTNSVHDMRVVNTDAKYYMKKTPERCLHDSTKA